MTILGESQLRSVLVEHRNHFNIARPHQALRQTTPVATQIRSYRNGSIVEAFPILGGLHHEYRVAA